MWVAARDARTPIPAELVAGAVAAYAFSPIDLIPDFIPVFGYLDDLVIVPLGIMLAVRLIPAPLSAEFRAAATDRPKPASAQERWSGLWVACLGLLTLLWLR